MKTAQELVTLKQESEANSDSDTVLCLLFSVYLYDSLFIPHFELVCKSNQGLLDQLVEGKLNDSHKY